MKCVYDYIGGSVACHGINLIIIGKTGNYNSDRSPYYVKTFISIGRVLSERRLRQP